MLHDSDTTEPFASHKQHTLGLSTSGVVPNIGACPTTNTDIVLVAMPPHIL